VIEIPVELGTRRYSVTVGHGAARLAAELLEPLSGRPIVVVADARVWALHGSRLGPALRRLGAAPPLLLRIGEHRKSWATLGALLGSLLRGGLRRDGLLVAVGGGVLSDLAGLAAALYMRGVDWVAVPTTLLGMVDASVGGKVAVNHPLAKNAIGAFHQPRAVLVDPELLRTLAARELQSGAYEILKCGVIGDRALFDSLAHGPDSLAAWERPALEGAIAAAIRLKADVVERDETERGLRRVLNLGHTLGHGLEAVTRYARFTHGEAVGWGLVGAAWLARERGRLSARDCDAIVSATNRLGPRPGLSRITPAAVLAALGRDKKARAGRRLTFVLPTALGRVDVVEDVRPDEVRRTLRALGTLRAPRG